MSGTAIAYARGPLRYGPTPPLRDVRYWHSLCATELSGYARHTPCPVLTWRMVLPQDGNPLSAPPGARVRYRPTRATECPVLTQRMVCYQTN
eukprot:1856946-Rhodomonas_salina.4